MIKLLAGILAFQLLGPLPGTMTRRSVSVVEWRAAVVTYLNTCVPSGVQTADLLLRSPAANLRRQAEALERCDAAEYTLRVLVDASREKE